MTYYHPPRSNILLEEHRRRMVVGIVIGLAFFFTINFLLDLGITELFRLWYYFQHGVDPNNFWDGALLYSGLSLIVALLVKDLIIIFTSAYVCARTIDEANYWDMTILAVLMIIIQNIWYFEIPELFYLGNWNTILVYILLLPLTLFGGRIWIHSR